jgi:ubiquinone/menaquinone biosynthesis C-methylase UbiE
MTADRTIYVSDRMAAAYAFSRPPVHLHVARRVAQYLAGACPVETALDLGCGAGVSTAALAPLARRAVGLEPQAPMLKYSSAVAPGAEFAIGYAEALPFADCTFDLVTAAGVLNYVDLDLALAEVARVLSLRGLFVPYDFSAGHRFRDDPRLSDWYAEFQLHFPSPSGYSLDLRALEYSEHGLDLIEYEEVEVEIAMPFGEYVDYILGESGVEHALARGRLEADVRRYCEECLRSVFSSGAPEVIFDAQIGYVGKQPPFGLRSGA